MQNIIVDSSVATKWYFEKDEAELDKAREIFDLVTNGELTLVAPKIILLELANTAKFGKKADKVHCLEAVTLFEEFIDKFDELPQMKVIIEKSYFGDIASYDAAFVALAEKLNVPLITADYKHHQKSISKNIVWLKEWKGEL